jgi:hypothetical protein
MPKMPRKKFAPNSKRKSRAEVRAKVIGILKEMKMNPMPYDEEDPYAGFLGSFSMRSLVESLDYVMDRYPNLRSVDRIIELIEEDHAEMEAERQHEERNR